MIEGQDELADMAEQHLPPDVRDQWLRLVRPAVELVEIPPDKAASAGTVVGQLGGDPHLPAEMDWPVWAGHGPLTFVASLDCAALPREHLDLPLPADGTLLFFYFDGQLDDGETIVIAEDPNSQPGARVIHLPAGTATVERPTPPDLEAYDPSLLTARRTASIGEPWHPVLHSAFAPPGTRVLTRYDHPVCDDAFLEAFYHWRSGSRHKVGGYPDAIQNPVEFECANTALGGTVDWQNPRLIAEANRWVLLAQIRGNANGDMMWGDAGALYWMIRPEDLAARRFDAAWCTSQCH